MLRTKTIRALLLTTALATTACTSTTAPLATPPIRQPEIPPVSTELLAKHERPERPASGSPQHLLDHAVRYGAYCQKLAAQVSGWQAWYRQQQGSLNAKDTP